MIFVHLPAGLHVVGKWQNVKRIFRSFLRLFVSIVEVVGHRGKEIGFVGEQAVAFDLGVDLIACQFVDDAGLFPLGPE